MYDVPWSVGQVSDTTAGWEWCGSPQRVASSAAVTAAGVSLNDGPGSPRMTAPPPNIDVAPPSLLRMCADSWHSTAPHGGHSADSPRALAAVPLTTGNTATSGYSKTSATRSRSRAVHSSPP